MSLIANVSIEQRFGDKKSVTRTMRCRNSNMTFMELAEQALSEDGCTQVTLVSLNCVINLRRSTT